MEFKDAIQDQFTVGSLKEKRGAMPPSFLIQSVEWRSFII